MLLRPDIVRGNKIEKWKHLNSLGRIIYIIPPNMHAGKCLEIVQWQVPLICLISGVREHDMECHTILLPLVLRVKCPVLERHSAFMTTITIPRQELTIASDLR